MTRKDIFKELIIEYHQDELPEIIEREIFLPLNTGKIISIVGVRRSGKTFLLFQTIKHLTEKIPKQKTVYINFEDERLDIKAEDLNLLIEAYKELYPENPLKEIYFFFDEIQNVEGWEKFIRRIYDRYTKNIFITGSNSKLLSREIATALRGRTITYEVFPLSFREFLKFKKLDFEEKDLYNIESRAKWKGLFTEYLKFGGFPEIILFEDKNLKIKILQEYFEVMLYRDLVERFQIKNPLILKYFIKRIVENVSKPISVNNIYNELKSQGYKVGKDTLYEFLDMVEAVYLAFVVRKYSTSVLKSELSQKKVYIVDNGLLNALSFSFKENLGALLENTIAKEFRAKGYEIFYYREKKECDFIVLKDEKFLPVQVSYSLHSENTLKREVDGLLEAIKFLRVKTGIIITFDKKDELIINDIKIDIVPAYYYTKIML